MLVFGLLKFATHAISGQLFHTNKCTCLRMAKIFQELLERRQFSWNCTRLLQNLSWASMQLSFGTESTNLAPALLHFQPSFCSLISFSLESSLGLSLASWILPCLAWSLASLNSLSSGSVTIPIICNWHLYHALKDNDNVIQAFQKHHSALHFEQQYLHMFTVVCSASYLKQPEILSKSRGCIIETVMKDCTVMVVCMDVSAEDALTTFQFRVILVN